MVVRVDQGVSSYFGLIAGALRALRAALEAWGRWCRRRCKGR